MRDLLVDLALPRTDAGAFTQAAVVAALFSAALWRARRNRDVLTFVAGLATITFAWFALRTLH